MRINKDLQQALKRYYFNRAAVDYGATWDKQADLENIRDVAHAKRIPWYAIAGTFWFTFDKVELRVDNLDNIKGDVSRKLRKGKWVNVE